MFENEDGAISAIAMFTGFLPEGLSKETKQALSVQDGGDMLIYQRLARYGSISREFLHLGRRLDLEGDGVVYAYDVDEEFGKLLRDFCAKNKDWPDLRWVFDTLQGLAVDYFGPFSADLGLEKVKQWTEGEIGIAQNLGLVAVNRNQRHLQLLRRVVLARQAYWNLADELQEARYGDWDGELDDKIFDEIGWLAQGAAEDASNVEMRHLRELDAKMREA